MSVGGNASGAKSAAHVCASGACHSSFEHGNGQIATSFHRSLVLEPQHRQETASLPYVTQINRSCQLGDSQQSDIYWMTYKYCQA